jgi:hypothetical protein
MMEWIALAGIAALALVCLAQAVAMIRRDRTFIDSQQACLLAQETAARHVEDAIGELKDVFGEIMKQERMWHLSAVSEERARARTLLEEADKRMRLYNDVIMSAKAPEPEIPFGKIRQVVNAQVQGILKSLYMPPLGQPPGPQGHPFVRPRGKTLDTAVPLEGFPGSRRDGGFQPGL